MEKELPAELWKIAIDWLEINQRNGFFHGMDEDAMNFRELSDADIRWYLRNWIFGIDGEKFGPQIRAN